MVLFWEYLLKTVVLSKIILFWQKLDTTVWFGQNGFILAKAAETQQCWPK